MKTFKFKSLTMRIWTIFTVLILLITLCLTVIYLIFVRYTDSRSKTRDLVGAHTYIMENNFDAPPQFDVFRNLRGSLHFIYLDGRICDVGRPPTNGLLMNESQINETPTNGASSNETPTNGSPISMNRFPPFNMDSGIPLPQYDHLAVRQWLLSFAEGALYANPFNRKFGDINFIFTISLLEDDSYFISYMPNNYDDSMMYYMLLISSLFIVVGFIAAKIIANYISKPLDKLENFTMRIAARDWKEPIILKNEDEIGRLAVSMNKMQEALKRADEDEKVFLQSISHDLKTPVMVIMSHADAIIDGVYIDTLDKTAQIIKDEAIRLNKKIKQLLYLNTLDYVLGNQTETTGIKLDEVIQRIVDKFEILGGHLLWTTDLEPVQIYGNEEKLIVAIENILDNALRYAKSTIHVSIQKGKKSVRMEMFNDGEPIKPENLDIIFQSLYKDKTGNFGLGLAITKKIITFFDGCIYAENRENGVSIIINYPL